MLRSGDRYFGKRSQETLLSGELGTILKTSDGGTNWSSQVWSNYQELNDVDFPLTMIGYIVGGNGTILKTENGGTTWVLQTSSTTENLISLSFPNYSCGFAIGVASNSLVKTINERLVWTPQEIEPFWSQGMLQLSSVYFTSATTGYVVGEEWYPPNPSNLNGFWVGQF